jgi:predicted dehydrogenase
VGAGLIGRRRAGVIARAAGSQLEVVADIDGQRAEEAAKELGCRYTTDWQEVVSDARVDAVVVSTINKFLAPIAVSAIRQGKHVLCEKPFGRSGTEAEAIVRAASEHGVTVKAGFNLRFHPAIRLARDVCARGEIGGLLFVRAVYGHGGRPGYEREWRADPDLAGGGELLDQGVHIADLCRWFLGELTCEAGVVVQGFWKVAPLEDNAFALLTSEDGKVASFHTSWTQWKNRFRFEVIGTDGYATVDGLGGSYGVEQLLVGRRRAEGGAPDEQRTDFAGPDESWEREWQEFVDAVVTGRTPMSDAKDALCTMRLIDSIYEVSRARAGVIAACL